MPNTIADNLARLQTARTDIANAITTIGGTVTSGDGFEDFPAEILGIPVGSQIVEGVFTPSNINTTIAKVWGCEGFIFGVIKGSATTVPGILGTVSGIDFPSTEPGTYAAYGAGYYRTSQYGGMIVDMDRVFFNFETGGVRFVSSYTRTSGEIGAGFVFTW